MSSYKIARSALIAKRKASEWLDYGDPNVWDREFERAVVETVKYITDNGPDKLDLISHFESKRHEIAYLRKNRKANLFGKRRERWSGLAYTPLRDFYGYALPRAVESYYNKGHYQTEQSATGDSLLRIFRDSQAKFDFGLIKGKIQDKSIDLTQYVFSTRDNLFEHHQIFGYEEELFVSTPSGPRAGVWLHPAPEVIPECIEHINKLVSKALTGDLTVIPRIHWWYVHLSPTFRGSGGTAEMLTNTLCRLHGIDLPPWKEGVAPSVEILLEPNEEEFCSGYHKLFETNQDELEQCFKSKHKLFETNQDELEQCFKSKCRM